MTHPDMNTASPAVELCEAHGPDLACIENLMQFYNYELSAWYPVAFAASGLYAIRSKAAYWAQPGVQPFLIRVDGELAGFAVVDDEVVQPQAAFNLGYFFVARRFRGQGVGLAAFAALLQRYPGVWEVYHLARNEPAGQFWARALQRLPVAGLAVSQELVHDEPSVMHRFTAAAPG